MVDLQQAKREAAERYAAIGMKYLPAGFTWHVRKSLSGSCEYTKMVISAPRPVTRKALYIFLHECAHAHLHYPFWKASPSLYRKRPKHVIEHEAELWAHARMKEHGIPVPRSMTERARAYVGRKIRQAEKRGAKKINPAARAFAKRSK